VPHDPPRGSGQGRRRRGLHVLVAAPGEVDEKECRRAELATDLDCSGQRVGGLDARDDPLGAAQQREGLHDAPSVRSGTRRARVPQEGVLRADAG
jgi:hypothetical protein